MNFLVKTSLGILLISIGIYAHVNQLDLKVNKQCQILQCNPTTEICYVNPDCKQDDILKCVFCLLKTNVTFSQQSLPSTVQLSTKSNESKVLIDNDGLQSNVTDDDASYDEYYEYDEDETSDKKNLNDDDVNADVDEYLDDYVESLDDLVDRSPPIRKLGTCPKVVEAIGKCDTEKLIPPECRFDTDCPGDLKCCEVACGRRICSVPLKPIASVCPTSFECSLNCRLGYRTDSNGCLQCECQSCPTMDQCNKNCPTGYLKDLFGCDTCECSDRCPPFTCNIICLPNVDYVQSEDGCPLCQCAISKSNLEQNSTSSCQEDIHCPPGFRCLNDARNVPMCQAVLPSNNQCPNDFAKSCNIQCTNGNYLLDDKGCPMCACMPTEEKPAVTCQEIKCRANCGSDGYQLDENGCRTCKCVSKAKVQCSGVMCRMFCVNGFKRDENGCPYCACNEKPQECPSLTCERSCTHGYRLDYNNCPTCDCQCPALICPAVVQTCTNYRKDADGCPTCFCDDQQDKNIDKCPVLDCNLNCQYGLQRDEAGCQLCSCNRCPLQQCRMFCMYGFRRSDDGCEICECDWTPVADRIQCSERISCPGTRACNLNLKLCETVNPEKINWFVFEFDVVTNMFQDTRFVHAFKNGFIKATQIVVSSVEQNGLTSFQIIPFVLENMEEFQKKVDQIDSDLNSYEFRSVLPAVARAIETGENPYPTRNPLDGIGEKFKTLTRKNTKLIIGVLVVLLIVSAFIIAAVYIHVCQRRLKYRSGSKVPIFDATYQQAPTDDDHYHAVHAPDGTAYVVVETDDVHSSSDKRVLV
ncbi:hypothetical protein I4U23_014062 [Adineta vaga]|nr:hypothetical protein I4U23_014062 [Adineta vaga]